MTEHQLAKLKEDATETINTINIENMTKNQFILLGACAGILNHQCDAMENVEETIEQSPSITLADTQNPIHHKSYAEIVKDEIADAEMYTDMGEYDIARQESEHAKYFLSKLKAQAVSSEDKALVRELWAHWNLANGRLQ